MKKNQLYFVLFSMLLLITSCKDFLDLEPKSAATDENFWKTQADANSAVAGMYSLLRSAFNNADGISYYAYGDLATDQFSTSNTYPFQHVVSMNWGLPLSVYATSDAMYLLRRYDLYYRVIDQANRVIEYVEKMDRSVFDSDRVRNFYLGEAYFMRAFTYFYMGRIWGGVPIITEAVAPIDAENHTAATHEQVMAQSLADLERAKQLLDWSNISNNDFGVRANKAAAFALDAHVHAWTGNYDAVLAATDSVISSGSYFYVSRDSIPYRTIFEGKSLEGIFEISLSAANEGTRTGIGQYTLAGSKYHRTITAPRLTTPKARLDSLFKDKTDKRLYVMDTTINSAYVICNKYANLTYSDETNNAVPVYKNNIIIFRYSDIKLLRAEALALKANPDLTGALTVLDEVRMQSGLRSFLIDVIRTEREVVDENGENQLIVEEEEVTRPLVRYELIKGIFDERARELFLEGHRFYDMVRLYKYGEIYEFDAGRMSEEQFVRGKHYWPFDPSLLRQNPLLRQTSFWATVGF